MNVSGARVAADIDLEEFEKRLRTAGAPAGGVEDPLAELARLVEASRPKAAGQAQRRRRLQRLGRRPSPPPPSRLRRLRRPSRLRRGPAFDEPSDPEPEIDRRI